MDTPDVAYAVDGRRARREQRINLVDGRHARNRPASRPSHGQQPHQRPQPAPPPTTYTSRPPTHDHPLTSHRFMHNPGSTRILASTPITITTGAALSQRMLARSPPTHLRVQSRLENAPLDASADGPGIPPSRRHVGRVSLLRVHSHPQNAPAYASGGPAVESAARALKGRADRPFT